jgi:hypothetical protein
MYIIIDTEISRVIHRLYNVGDIKISYLRRKKKASTCLDASMNISCRSVYLGHSVPVCSESDHWEDKVSVRVLNYDNKPLSVLSISVKGIWGPRAPFLPKAWFYTAVHIWKLNIFEKKFRKPITRLNYR